MRVGAIDVGTNTTRLLVVEAGTGGYRDLERRLEFTRLGRGVDAAGHFDREAMAKTLKTVAEYCAICGELGAQRIRVGCTSAVRDSADRDELLDGMRSLSGVEVELLSGEEEAKLSFLGATHGINDPGVLVLDIGGGSTEFVHGEPGGSPDYAKSVDMGSVRLTERCLHSDPPATEEMLIMEQAVLDLLNELIVDLPDLSDSRLIGVAGTVTSLAALYLGIETYEPSATHGAKVALKDLVNIYRRLARTSLADRERLPSLPPGRADVIVAGAAILVHSMSELGFDEVIVSERDILDGLVIQML